MPELRCELCRNWESVIDPDAVESKYHDECSCTICTYDHKSWNSVMKDHTVHNYNSVVGERIVV